MVNRQSRSPGELRQYQGLATISGDVPNIAIDQGAAFRALEEVGGQLAGHLMQLAGQAKEREQGLAGLAYGQDKAATYLQARAVEQRAAERVQAGEGVHAHGAPSAGGKNLPVVTGQQAGRKFAPDMSGVRPEVMSRFKALQDAFGESITVVSGYRGSARNAAAGGAKKSQHLHGNALDLDVSGWSNEKRVNFIKAASAQGFTGIGVYNNSIHLDTASRRAWGPSHHSDSIPGWAQGVIGEHLGRKGGDVATPAENGPSYSTRHGLPAIPTGPLQLRNDGTIGGEAFDKAAIQAYSWRMAQGITTDLANAHEDFKDDPAAFAKRMGEVRNTYMQDEALADPRVRETFDKVFAEHSAAYVRDVTDRQGKRLQAEQEAALADGLTAQTNALEKQAYILGANPEGAAILGTQMQRSFAAIDAAVANGTMEPADAAKQRRTMESALLRGQVQGTFDALDTPEAKEQFALSIMDDWAKGEGPLAARPLEDVKALSETLRRDARAEANSRDATNVLEKARIEQLVQDDVASIGASGKGVNFDTGGLDAGVVAKVLGADKALDWAQKRELAGMQWEATAGMETQNETAIAARLAALEPKPGEAGYDGKLKVFEGAQKQAEKLLKSRADDPAGASEAAFPQIAELADVSDPAKPDTMQSLVQARLEGQAALGIPEFTRDPLTKKEAANLARSLTGDLDPASQGKAVTALAEQVDAAYGPHANAVMAQVLNQTGVDRDLAKAGAATLARIRRGDRPAKADMRAGSVAVEAAAADKAGQPRQTDAFAVPNYKQQQMLLENPELATQFDAKFGPGAAAKILGPSKHDPAQMQVPQGTVTLNPDGSESFKPNGQ